MIIGIFSFFLGNLSVHQLASLPEVWWSVGLLGILAILHYYSAHVITRSLLCVACGFTLTVWHAQRILDWELPKALEGQDIVITGVVAGLPQVDSKRVRFVFAVCDFPAVGDTSRILLSWYQQPPDLQVGQQWQLQVRLKRPHSMLNPGGFDYERWLFLQGIRATGYVRESVDNQLLESGVSGYRLTRMRQWVADAIQHSIGESPMLGFVHALTMGAQQHVSSEQWRVLRVTGTSHLIAISGLHIGLVAGFCFWLGRWLWCTRWCLFFPAQQVGAVVAVFGALGYAMLAGFAVPTQRALIMLAVFMLAFMLRQHMTLWRGWWCALFLVVLWDPLATLTPGFYLSFAAVALIFYGLRGRFCPSGLWWKIGRVQWVVGLGLMPLTLWLFQQASIISVVANVIAVPWVGFIVVPLSLLGLGILVAFDWSGVLHVAVWALQLIWWVLAWMAELPGAQWLYHVPNPIVLLLMWAGLLLLLAPRAWPGRWLSGLCLFPLLFPYVARPDVGDMWFTVLDVGQGLAAVVQTQHHVLVYDTGPPIGTESNEGHIARFLRSQQLARIDKLVLSHGHYDHMGGVASLLAATPVGEIYASEAKGLHGLEINYCVAGYQWVWDGVQFAFLHPPQPGILTSNNSSCVLQITAGDKTVLLTGDIERRAENMLLADSATALSADVLQVPHHGSRTSSTELFVQAVDPQYVVFPLGYRNRFGFPHADVVERYQAIGAKLYTTANSGAITFRLSKQQSIPAPSEYRCLKQRYWMADIGIKIGQC